jgi:hypothetical protein
VPTFGPVTYRILAVTWVLVFALFVAAFLAVTVLGRSRWSALGQLESLLARLSASALLAVLCAGSAYMLVGQVMYVFLRQADTPDLGSGDVARTQTLVAMLVALGLAIMAMFRIEIYHRRMVGGPPVEEEEGEWKLEEPGKIKRR